MNSNFRALLKKIVPTRSSQQCSSQMVSVAHFRPILSLISLLIVYLVHPSAAMSSENLKPFPTTLEGFGYTFNKDGELRKIDPATGQPGNESFQFNISPDASFNQKNYEALGDVITEYVYKLLESPDVGLRRLRVPKRSESDDAPSTFIFASDDALTNPDKMVILIHGSGVVRAGQWARSLIINENLKVGTQIPYIQKAKALGYGVLVLNTNDNQRLVDGKRVFIKDSSTPPEHTDYVWRHYVGEAKAKKIALVAHSYGGICSVSLASRHLEDFKSRVFAIALTDSVHSSGMKKMCPEVISYLRKVGCNWVASAEPLDTPVDGPDNDIRRVSAGHPKHESTSGSCMDSLFKFLESLYETNAKVEL